MEPISLHNRSYESQSRSTMTLGVGVRIIVFLIIGVVTYFAFTKGITLFSWHPTLMLIGVSNSSFGYVLFHIFQSSLSVSLSCDSEKQLCQPRTNQYIFSICLLCSCILDALVWMNTWIRVICQCFSQNLCAVIEFREMSGFFFDLCRPSFLFSHVYVYIRMNVHCANEYGSYVCSCTRYSCVRNKFRSHV